MRTITTGRRLPSGGLRALPALPREQLRWDQNRIMATPLEFDAFPKRRALTSLPLRRAPSHRRWKNYIIAVLHCQSETDVRVCDRSLPCYASNDLLAVSQDE